MKSSDTDTIAAIATAAGRGGIGVVRVSGKRAGEVMRGILGRETAPRQASFGAFMDAAGRPLDLECCYSPYGIASN